MSKSCTGGVYSIGGSIYVCFASELGSVGCALAAFVASVNTTPRHNMNDRIEGDDIRVFLVDLLLGDDLESSFVPIFL